MISDKKISQFENHIGYTFKNRKLLIDSLIHPSFLVDNKKNLSATIMTQVLFGNPELTREFYKYIYSNF